MRDMSTSSARSSLPLVRDGDAWQKLQLALRQDFSRPHGRIQKLMRYGFEPMTMTMWYFRAAPDLKGLQPSDLSLSELEASVGLGKDVEYRAEVKILGTLEYVGALPESYRTPPSARNYADAIGRLAKRLDACYGGTTVAHDSNVIREFQMTALTRLPVGMPLAEAPALTAVCANLPLLARLRKAGAQTPNEEAIQFRFGFGEEHLNFRSHAEVAQLLDRTVTDVRGSTERLLRSLGHRPL